MAILLRAPSGKAEIFAKQFECAGIPLIVERGGFYDSSEVLDLLSVLQLLDNPLQDVPVIAVLHSPLVGLALDELAQIRLAANGHFWFALNQIENLKYKIQNELKTKVESFLERFHRWRKLAQRSSLSQCLEAILSETHYADWLKSRPRGVQRHANIDQFLNLAQKFDQFQRQGLFRFLKFIESQREAGVEPEVSPVADENAVRLMSIHQSKGLEFPVVAVADLAKNFNSQDLRGEIIFDGEFGLCPRVKPPQTGRRYSSLPHWLAQQRQRKEQAGEELRLLYVAMTRARDNLILTCSLTKKKWETLWNETGTINVQKILAAKSYADWLGLWFAQNADDQEKLPNLCWRIADDSELAGETAAKKSEAKAELPELDDEAKRRLREVLTWNYGFEAVTERAAKSSVTALRRQAGESDEEAEQVFGFRFSGKQTPQKWKVENLKHKLSAVDMGAATHKFLQLFNLKNAEDLKSLKAEARRLEKEKMLSSDELAVLDLNALEDFWNSEIGEKIRVNTAFVKRELPFTAKFTPKELDEILGTKSGANLGNEFVVVQGVADLAVLLPGEIWIVDFKTDEIRADEFAEKIKIYAPQLKFYARALSKIYSRPVTNCWLHFLSERRTAKI
jgi:ATP-dependent helicase/nuclease subunit A